MTVSGWKEINKKSLLGSCDIALDSGFLIHGALVMTGTNGNWVNFPGIPSFNSDKTPFLKDGKQVYKPVLTIPDRDRRDKFSELVLAELKAQGVL